VDLKVLGICGSPRKDGNTHQLLQRLLDGVALARADKEFISMSDLKISPCRECHSCDKTGICVIDDDMKIMYPKFCDADRVIIASPIFFGSVTANIKAIIDRCQCLWVKKYILKQKISDKTGRRGAFISVCGGKIKDFFPGAALVIKSLFTTIDIKYEFELFYSQIDEKGAVKLHPTALEDAFELGKKITKI